MNIERLKSQLIRDEEFVPHAYQDSEGFWSIGVGRLIDKRLGGGLTEEEGAYLLENDIKKAQFFASIYSWYGMLDEVRQNAIVNMMFNLGPGKFDKFKKMTAAIELKDWREAAAQMLDSVWAKQVGARAERLATMMTTGEWP